MACPRGARDLNAVAGWANILALPVSVLGLVFVLADRAGARAATDATAHSVLTGHTSWVDGAAFSPDGTLLATTSNDGTVRLWQIPSGTCHCALRLAGPLVGIAWHPGGTILCTVGGAGVYLLSYQP